MKQLSHLRYAFLDSRLESQELTLRTISHDIHDNIGQVLSLVKLQLHGLKNHPQFQDAVQPTVELLGKAIKDLRDLGRSLNPDRIAQTGLCDSVLDELDLLQKTNTLQTKIQIKGHLHGLSPEKEMIVFRVFQELMNIAIKVANAGSLSVVLNFQPNSLKLTVCGDGIGLLPDTLPGIGLAGLKNRAKLINATLTLNSNPAQGTMAEMIVPF